MKGVDVAGDPGSLTWVELYTPDIAAAAAFYYASLGLETSAAPMPGGDYTCLNPSGAGEDAMFGGVVPLDVDPDGAASGAYWLAYFEVADVDATVAKALETGGKVAVPAAGMEGVGRIAQLTDPHGARFAVIKSEPPQG